MSEYGWSEKVDPAATAVMTCQKADSEKLQGFFRFTAKHSASSFFDSLTHAGYKDVPASYLLCEEDLAGPPELQRDMIAGMEDVSSRKIDVTSTNSDHSPHLSVEEEMIKWIVSVAKNAYEAQQVAHEKIGSA